MDNVVVRDVPIFISDRYNLDYHQKAFLHLCELLDGYASKIIISFLDEYKNVKNNYKVLKYKKIIDEDYKEIGISFSKSASIHNMTVQTCFEDKNLTEYGFIKDECISSSLAYIMTGKKYPLWKARKELLCSCVSMVDIGVHNSCKHFCKYCYANYDETIVNDNCLNHDANSSLIIGKISDDDIIKI